MDEGLGSVRKVIDSNPSGSIMNPHVTKAFSVVILFYNIRQRNGNMIRSGFFFIQSVSAYLWKLFKLSITSVLTSTTSVHININYKKM